MNTPQVKCFAHFHMTAQQYGFWDVCRSLAHKNDILYFNGRSIAERFQGMSKSTAYLLADALAKGGWLKLVKDSTRRKDGTFSPKQYRVLSHAEWAAEHPEGCIPVQPTGLDDISPVQPADSPVQPADQPVQPAGHNLIDIPTNKQPATEPDNHRPFQPAGLDGFVDRFLKPTKAARQRRSAGAPNLDTAPVQPVGLDAGRGVSSTESAERIATAVCNTIGVTSANERAAWVSGLSQLLDAGHSTSDVLQVVEFAHSRFRPNTVRQEGPAGFIQHFDLIKSGMMAEAAKGKTA